MGESASLLLGVNKKGGKTVNVVAKEEFLKLTLYEPRFLTEQANFIFLPAGTVMLSMTSVNSGSSVSTEMRAQIRNCY